MKKILTVSLFAMMAVSAANAEIASTKYVDDAKGAAISAAAADATTKADAAKEAAIAAIPAVDSTFSASSDNAATSKAIANYVTGIKNELSNGNTVAVEGLQGQIDDLETSLSATGTTGKAIADNTAAITAMDTAYKAADETTLSSAKSYADGLAGNYDAAGSAAQALTDAKAYADAEDKKIEDTIGTVESGKTVVQMINEASTSAGTNLTNALQDYSTTTQMNTAIKDANDAQTSAIKTAYEAADTALETSLKSYADTAEADAIAAAKTAGDAAYDSKGSAAAAQTAAVNAAKDAADATYQVKSSALSVGAADGAWTDLTKADGYSTTGTHSLVLKNGTIQWEAVSY